MVDNSYRIFGTHGYSGQTPKRPTHHIADEQEGFAGAFT